jgi:hypothetical protein
MSFIETYSIEPEHAHPVAAIKGAFTCLKQGGSYTLKLIVSCGLFLCLVYWIGEQFEFNSATSIPQVVVEAAFAYYWHRFVLLGEAKPTSDDFMPFLKRSLFYHLLLVVVLVAVLVGFLGLSFLKTGEGGANVNFIGVALAVCVLTFIMPRVALVFPALAVNSPESRMSDALTLSSGNAFRLVAGYLMMVGLIILIVSPFILSLFLAVEFLANEAFLLLSNFLMGVVVALTVLLWAGLNSFFYRQLGGMIPSETEPDEARSG